MSDLETFLASKIPTDVAAGFFHRIKTAGWTDPPDETGMLEGQFIAPVEQVVAKVGEVVAAKFRKAVAYYIYAQSMRGLAQQSIADEFMEHACQEQCAAEAYLKRAAVLGGGPVHVPEIETPPASAQPLDIIMRMARAEQEGIAAQRELRAMVGEENPFRAQIDQFMVEDQYHLDELWQLMPSDAHVGGDVIPAEGEELAEGEEQVPSEEGEELEEAAPPELDEKTASSDSELKEKGRERAVTNMAAEAYRDKARRGERFGSLAGSAVGALGGAALGKTPVTRAAGGALGYLVGSKAGKTVGEEVDMRKNAGSVIQFPGKGERFVRRVRKVLRNKVPKRSESPKPPTGGSMDPDAFLRTPGMLGLGALTGAGIGAFHYTSAAGGLKKKERQELEAGGGPITRKWLKSPGTVGAIHGGLGLPLAMYGASKRGIPGALGGAAAPVIAGLAANSLLKKREDKKAALQKNAEARFDAALRKLGYYPGQEAATGPDEAPVSDSQLGPAGEPSPQGMGSQPMMANPPGSQRFDPVNYLEAEQVAREAQEQNEAGFYRERAHAAEAQNQSMGQMVQAIQEQLNQLQAQAAESGSQVLQANQEASAAHDSALQQATLAARMRMGMQALRAQMMEIASQDPEQLAAAAGGPSPSEVGDVMAEGEVGNMGQQQTMDPSGQAEPGAQPGTPGAAPAQGSQPGTPPPGAGAPGPAPETQNASGEAGQNADETAELQSRKEGSAVRQTIRQSAPWAAGGALIGAVQGVREGGKVDAMRAKVEELQGKQDGGFTRALEIAHAQMDLASAEKAKRSPGVAALKGGVRGAGMGMAVGSLLRSGKHELGRARKNIQDLRSI